MSASSVAKRPVLALLEDLMFPNSAWHTAEDAASASVVAGPGPPVSAEDAMQRIMETSSSLAS
jgi:hypothetical protein